MLHAISEQYGIPRAPRPRGPEAPRLRSSSSIPRELIFNRKVKRRHFRVVSMMSHVDYPFGSSPFIIQSRYVTGDRLFWLNASMNEPFSRLCIYPVSKSYLLSSPHDGIVTHPYPNVGGNISCRNSTVLLAHPSWASLFDACATPDVAFVSSGTLLTAFLRATRVRMCRSDSHRVSSDDALSLIPAPNPAAVNASIT